MLKQRAMERTISNNYIFNGEGLCRVPKMIKKNKMLKPKI